MGRWGARPATSCGHLLLILASLCYLTHAEHDRDVDSLIGDIRVFYNLSGTAATSSWAPGIKLTRRLDGTGFHQMIQYDVQIPGPRNDGTGVCELLMVQPLPRDLYADPYQLGDLVRYHKNFKFELFGPLDLELPAPVCRDTALVLRASVSAVASGESKAGRSVLSVPLHAKYPESKSHSRAAEPGSDNHLSPQHAHVTVPLPWLMTDCLASGRMLRPPPDQQSFGEPLIWDVPSGNLDHVDGVAAATTLMAALCTMLLVVSSYRWKDPSR